MGNGKQAQANDLPTHTGCRYMASPRSVNAPDTLLYLWINQPLHKKTNPHTGKIATYSVMKLALCQYFIFQVLYPVHLLQFCKGEDGTNNNHNA